MERPIHGLEKSALLSTFTKIDTRRLQLPTDQQQQPNNVIALTDSMVQRSKSIWVSRHEFHAVIQLIGDSGCATLQAAVDTGSDWCCMTPDNIHKVSENPYNLCPPSPEMMATKSASGDYMKPVLFFNA